MQRNIELSWRARISRPTDIDEKSTTRKDPYPKIADGRYELTEFIAKGGMGAIYRAHDVKLNRSVAIKCLLDVTQPEGKERAVREARTLASLSHPNIMRIYDITSNNDQVWIVSEWLEGKSLAELTLPISPAFALAIMSKVFGGLSAAHDAKIIHRDIKPQNIMLCDDGQISLLDFGVAFQQGVSTGETIAGSLRYTDPRILEGTHPDARSDLFSASLVLIELMTGEKVLPDLAPIPLYRHMKRNLPARIERVLEGIYPPLQEMLREFTDITRISTRSTTDLALTAEQKCMDALFAITQKAPEDYLKAYNLNAAKANKNSEQTMIRQADSKIESPKTPAQEKASWIAFRETMTPSQKTELQKLVYGPIKTSTKTNMLRMALIIAGAVATCFFIFSKNQLLLRTPNDISAIETLPQTTKILDEVDSPYLSQEAAKQDSEKQGPHKGIPEENSSPSTPKEQDARISLLNKRSAKPSNSVTNPKAEKTDSASTQGLDKSKKMARPAETANAFNAPRELRDDASESDSAGTENAMRPNTPHEALRKDGNLEIAEGHLANDSSAAQPATSSLPPSTEKFISSSKNNVSDDLHDGKFQLFLTANTPATVFISGVEVGDLPREEGFWLEPGTYQIKLENPYTNAFETKIKITDKPRKFRFNLVGKITERILVLSTPGHLYVNGVDHGIVTEKKLPLAFGTHEVWIKRGDRIIKPRNLLIEPESPVRVQLEAGGVH